MGKHSFIQCLVLTECFLKSGTASHSKIKSDIYRFLQNSASKFEVRVVFCRQQMLMFVCLPCRCVNTAVAITCVKNTSSLTSSFLYYRIAM